MQKGFATLEIIFAILIIAMLWTATVPNAARILDRAALDYEYKKLYSDLRLLQSLNRSGTFDSRGTGNTSLKQGNKIFLQINSASRSWQIFRDNKTVSEKHFLSNGIKISGANKISFDTTGKADFQGTIFLTSHYGKPNKIVFDPVGRFRGGRGDD